MKYTIEVDDKPAVKAIERIQKAIKELDNTPVNIQMKYGDVKTSIWSVPYWQLWTYGILCSLCGIIVTRLMT